MLNAVFRRLALLVLTWLATGCASSTVTFPNATPGASRTVPGWVLEPAGPPPFPAVMLLHGCHGVSASTHQWSRWFRDEGYVALIVDSWAARGMREGCSPQSLDVANTERLDDSVGALRYLRSRSDVDAQRIGVIGWSNGGVFAMSLVNGPSLERARQRGIVVPEPGVRAAIAVYPGGCPSLVQERVVRPLLVLLGDADDWTVPGPCVEMVNAMRGRGADASIVLYPGAFHYFDVEGQARTYLTDVMNDNRPGGCCGATVSYDAAAAADARRRVREFFQRHLRGTPAPLGRAAAWPPGAGGEVAEGAPLGRAAAWPPGARGEVSEGASRPL